MNYNIAMSDLEASDIFGYLIEVGVAIHDRVRPTFPSGRPSSDPRRTMHWSRSRARLSTYCSMEVGTKIGIKLSGDTSLIALAMGVALATRRGSGCASCRNCMSVIPYRRRLK